MNQFVKALLISISGLLLLDAMVVVVKYLRLTSDLDVGFIAFFRNFFGLIPAFFLLYLSRTWVDAGKPFYMRQWKLALFRGVCIGCAQISLYTALKFLPIATIATIENTGPAVITLLSVPLLGERIGLWRISAVLIGFLGVLLIVNPWDEAFNFIWILPIFAMLGYSISMIFSRMFDREIPTSLINLYTGLSTFVVLAIFCIYRGSFTSLPSDQEWSLLLLMGLFGGFGGILYTLAYRLESPSKLSPFNYLQILFGLILGYIFFDEWPIDSLFPGAVLIVAAGLIILYRERAQGIQQG